MKFNVNFNVNFNILLSKFVVHPLVKIKETDNIKMHGITMKIITYFIASFFMVLQSYKMSESSMSLALLLHAYSVFYKNTFFPESRRYAMNSYRN